jgi:hypothetical protein
MRDGQYIDANFPQYDRIRKKHKCVPEICVYLPAPDKTQELVIGLFKKITLKCFNADDWDAMMEEFVTVARIAKVTEPMFHKSFQNCIMEQYYNGGDIIFGSMGFKKKDGTYQWEYGGPDYLTVKDFRL